MSPELKQFIQENKNLINENTKESWEEIYDKFDNRPSLKGEFTKIILDTGITDPASIMGYIPKLYLYESNIQDYKIPNGIMIISD